MSNFLQGSARRTYPNVGVNTLVLAETELEKTTVVMSFKIPANLRSEIKRLVQEGIFINQSDFLREAVRAKLKECS